MTRARKGSGCGRAIHHLDTGHDETQEYSVELSPDPWVRALRNSHSRLRDHVEAMDATAVQRPSYASEWTIAQVLSHLGSGAEIFGIFLDCGLRGAEPPAQDAFGPIWQRWNERSPQAQVTDGLAADEKLLISIESVDAAHRVSLRLNLFGMDMDLTGLAGMRLNEHAVHTWDVIVPGDPAAVLAADATALMIDSLGRIAAWAGKPSGTPLAVTVLTTDPGRTFALRSDAQVSIQPGRAGDGGPELRLPAEALIRLVYGRLDPAHTPAVQADGVELDDIRRIFPGM
jgi:uncharacterized protein (TIGR03083 family)